MPLIRFPEGDREAETLGPLDLGVTVERVETFVVAARPKSPPKSAMGSMPVRNGLLLRITAADGAVGWGEAWCNFPPPTASYRAALLREVVAPGILGRRFDAPAALRAHLEDRWRIMAYHTGEPGAFAALIAGLDIAAWDLVARRAGLSLAQAVRRVVGGEVVPRVGVYASTPDPDRIDAHIDEVVAAGHDAVKLKVGYDAERDDALVSAVRARAGESFEILVDANQSWSVDEAVQSIASLSRHVLGFVEEPISGHAPAQDWGALARAVTTPVAGGENIPTRAALLTLVEAGGLGVYQPSITKFGGVDGWIENTTLAAERGVAVCPHYMGTALGLAASLQMLSLTPHPGRQELDSNDNPLRTDLGGPDLRVEAGRVAVPDGSGLGFEPAPEPWLVPGGHAAVEA